jgi:hypothetical protein
VLLGVEEDKITLHTHIHPHAHTHKDSIVKSTRNHLKKKWGGVRDIKEI